LSAIGAIEIGRQEMAVYRIVKVVDGQ